ncbi:sulfate permease CysP [Paenibacillus sp. J31TS4]|uniref:inorganic phosphate transporter n=1 Tax=Paenibacillus sp. J31TS4 TaxID=2807195 RepID=UPI001B18B943|nr:inorganic phosphate transporter [Paenibacillus sp. J31TS4]GIP39433.1 sulfate permease CysP [Paenibacillus sp. J31TS4]
MSITWIAVAIAFFFAMNIGASGAAASMGVAYGTGSIRRKRLALLCVAAAVFLGAYLGGGEVVKTLGSGIVPQQLLTVETVIIILLAASLTLFGANLMGIPLSTSEVTVGSVIGIGVAYQQLQGATILLIVSFWVVIPFLAFALAWGGGLLIRRFGRRSAADGSSGGTRTKILSLLVVAAGCFEAFSAGMNNVANAVGPLVGAGLMSTGSGILWGGLFVALGAVLLGGRVLETNGKKITRLSLPQGILISGTGGALVVVASLMGIPVPLTQITTTAILGIGTAEQGRKLWQKDIIGKILKVWIVSPVVSLVVSYTLVKLFLLPDPFVLIVLAAILVSSVGLKSLYDASQYEKRNVNEDGSGI